VNEYLNVKASFLCILAVCLLTSCEKIFHEEEISIGEIKNPDELKQAANGVYGKLSDAFNASYFNLSILKGDDLNNSTPNYSGFYGLKDCWNEGDLNWSTSVAWEKLYSIIASVNNILNQYNLSSISDKRIRGILGEVLYIRAYCYFRLTRTYGEVPVINNIDISYTVSKSSFTDIYKFIESDLNNAMALLPENNAKARLPYETPHRGTAKALLAEVYLSWAGYPVKDISKYELAMSEAGEVIDSADYFGLGMVSDFAHLWDKEHYFNEESVFALYYANPERSTIMDEINKSYLGFSFENSYDQCFMINPNSKYIGLFYYCTEVNFYNKYPRNYRKEICFYSTIYVPAEFSDKDTGYLYLDEVDICNRIGCRKFYYEPYEVSMNQYYPGSSYLIFLAGNPRIYVFRFAHTLLTYAEASARSGQLNEKAYECVNRIRRRAHNVDIYTPSVYDIQPGLSPEVFADSVVWERAWELAGEPEGRWFDLIRLEMVEDLPGLRHPDEGGPPETFDKSAYFFPVPEGDIRLNPNLRNK